MNNNCLIECIPNFSEGRDPDVIGAIRDSILKNSDAQIWDHSSDRDHNRSVFTIAGTPAAMEDAVMSFTRTAAELINMETHEGVHPCIGAVDVIPFVPLKDITMEDCIAFSDSIAGRIAEELSLPVYLYAKSAKKAAHIRLADIRRGGYHGLKQVIRSDPDRRPDYGPLCLPAAGGVSVGARDFLIAYNIFLDTTDTAPAKRIAKKIRESSGGFPGVQAIGLSVSGMAQVSMNLLDYRKTSMRDVFFAVKSEAERLGISVYGSELIGMLPRAAMQGTDADELLLRNFSPSRFLEEHYS
ncbi:MAG: glutamate formimidoyltransferase [Anaerolineaceae bacterium]|nr:glutamate formimidoyltransferase [Anaerolineaceae bacterium]